MKSQSASPSYLRFLRRPIVGGLLALGPGLFLCPCPSPAGVTPGAVSPAATVIAQPPPEAKEIKSFKVDEKAFPAIWSPDGQWLATLTNRPAPKEDGAFVTFTTVKIWHG